MAENIPTDSVMAAISGPKYGVEQYQQYLGDLGQARQQLPALLEQERGLLANQYGAAQRAIQQGERQGLQSMSQEAARGMAAAMGQAGAMPVGGGSAATMPAWPRAQPLCRGAPGDLSRPGRGCRHHGRYPARAAG